MRKLPNLRNFAASPLGRHLRCVVSILDDVAATGPYTVNLEKAIFAQLQREAVHLQDMLRPNTQRATKGRLTSS